MNPNYNRNIASLQARWLVELKELTASQSREDACSDAATCASTSSPGSRAVSRCSSPSNTTEVVPIDLKGAMITHLTKGGTDPHWHAAPLDYPTLAIDPPYLASRLVCPIIPKYTLPQWMMEEMALNTRCIAKTPPNPPKVFKGRMFPVPLQGSDYSPPPKRMFVPDPPKLTRSTSIAHVRDDDIPVIPECYDDIPTLTVCYDGTPITQVCYNDIPTLPVDHYDIPTPPAIEERTNTRALRRPLPSTSGATFRGTWTPSEVTAQETLKRKRAAPGALERAVDKAAEVKRRRRGGEVQRTPAWSKDGIEKENVWLNKPRLSKLAKHKV